MAPREVNWVSVFVNPILFLGAVLDFVFSALEYNINPLEYEYQGMALTPSCKGIGVDFVH